MTTTIPIAPFVIDPPDPLVLRMMATPAVLFSALKEMGLLHEPLALPEPVKRKRGPSPYDFHKPLEGEMRLRDWCQMQAKKEGKRWQTIMDHFGRKKYPDLQVRRVGGKCVFVKV